MKPETKKILWVLGIVAVAAAGWKGIEMGTRALRANNAGSLDDIGQDYGAPEGLVKPNPDTRLLTFISPFYGVRALVAQMYNTMIKHGHNTLVTFIHSYSPASDGNNEAAYVQFLSENTGLDPDIIITPQIFKLYAGLLAEAVGRMETGRNIKSEWGIIPVNDGVKAGLQHVGLA